MPESTTPHRSKTTIEAEMMTPAQIREACKSLSPSDFPAVVTMGTGDPLELYSLRDASLFCVGILFGAMAEMNTRVVEAPAASAG